MRTISLLPCLINIYFCEKKITMYFSQFCEWSLCGSVLACVFSVEFPRKGTIFEQCLITTEKVMKLTLIKDSKAIMSNLLSHWKISWVVDQNFILILWWFQLPALAFLSQVSTCSVSRPQSRRSEVKTSTAKILWGQHVALLFCVALLISKTTILNIENLL